MPAYGIALSLRLLPSLVPHLVKLNGDLDKVTFYRGTKYLQADFKLGEQGYKLQIFSDGTGIKLFNSSWDPIWQAALKSDLTPKSITLPYQEGIESDNTDANYANLSICGKVAAVHFRAKRTGDNYVIAVTPEVYRPIVQANCVMSTPACSSDATYGAMIVGYGQIRFSVVAPKDRIFEGDLAYIIK